MPWEIGLRYQSNAFNEDMQSDSEAMLRNINDRCQKLEQTAQKLSMAKPDVKKHSDSTKENINQAKPKNYTPNTNIENKRSSEVLKKKHKVAWVGNSISKQ